MALDNLMIDIETMGNRPNAPVLTIGAVFFDPDTGKLGGEFYESISVVDALKYGTPDGGTLAWWLEQSEPARKAVVAGRRELAEALIALREFGGARWPGIKVWGNGPSFDMTILEYAYHRCLGTKAPWDFWNISDCRTVAHIAGMRPPKIGGKGTHHNALDDAKHQAEWVSRMWQGLRYGPKQKAAPAPAADGGLLDDL